MTWPSLEVAGAEFGVQRRGPGWEWVRSSSCRVRAALVDSVVLEMIVAGRRGDDVAVERVMVAAGGLRRRAESAVDRAVIARSWLRGQGSPNATPERSPRPGPTRPLSPNYRFHQSPAVVTPLEASGAPIRPEAGRRRAQVKQVVGWPGLTTTLAHRHASWA